jgi:tetratricopeptide (TPR) repeat protein
VRAAVFLALVVAARADEETARFFVAKGRDAFAAADWEKVDHWAQRALEEEKDYAPARLLLADAAERQGRRADAITHLEACLAQEGRGDLAEEAQRAVRDARERLAKLDEARFELERIVEDYVKQALALAEREAQKNPELARECWRSVLLVQPGNAEAANRLEAPAAPPEPEAGTPLFNGKDLADWTGGEPSWTFCDGLLVGSVVDTASVTRHKEEVKGDYSLVCELRVAEDTGDNPLCGIVFGLRGSYDHFGLWIWDDHWRYEHQTAERERATLHRCEYRTHKEKYDRFAWNTYRIDVEGKRVTAWVNGRKIWSMSGAVRSLDGFPGLWVQEQTIEVRKFVLVPK